jgi:NodT family efflux transporter outer membrane factor (OMF) lipoprotein
MTPPLSRRGFALALPATLGACALGPAFRKPAVDTPAVFREAGPAGAVVWPASGWWKGFRSATLDQLIATARAKSFDIAAAAARVLQADAALRQAGAALLPAVSASGKDDWSRSYVNSGFGKGYAESRTYSLAPSASYELDLWGKLRATKESALASAIQSRYDAATVALTTVASIATTWFQALGYADRIAIARRNLDASASILEAIRAGQEAGINSALDVAQQEALVAGIRAGIPGLESSLVQTLNGLGVLIGEAPERITVQPGTLGALALPEVAPGLPAALLERRPDVASAEAQLVAANANLRAARAAFFPDVTLTGTGGWSAIALSTLFGPGSLFAQAAAQAVQTVFDNGAIAAQVAADRGRYEELLADYRKAVVQAFTDVEDGAAAYRLATEQERLEQDAVRTAQLAADISRAQVLAGTVNIVTSLQAQQTLYSDLDTLSQVRLARFTSLVALYKALGGGWSVADVPTPAHPINQGVL